MRAQRGDNIDIAMFYLADRAVIESLLAASRRGVAVRVILDPNKDAFGHAKTGIPNQPVASELVAASDGAIHVRWYRTHGEQFHTKLAMIYGPERFWLTAGLGQLHSPQPGRLQPRGQPGQSSCRAARRSRSRRSITSKPCGATGPRWASSTRPTSASTPTRPSCTTGSTG